MTSAVFKSVPISSIIINRSERQRGELRGVEDLAESISRLGLIHPPVITSDFVLVSGETRIEACRRLGWTSIPVQFASDLSEYELFSIELEENIKRTDLTWQEQAAAIERFHELKLKHEESWSTEKTAEALGISLSNVKRNVMVAKELSNEKVASAPKFSAALNVVQRNLERRKASAVEKIEAKAEASLPVEEAPKEKPAPPILNANFHEWQETYDGPRFNLIHCDFPYGINVADSPRQNAALSDHYVDTPDTYFALLNRLELAMQNVVAESAHLIFWFSMDFYSQTVERLSSMGWRVNPFPLIWHKSDNAGIAPDPQRAPRRTYETALFASLGDRKLTQVGPRSNSFAHPGRRDDSIHISEKPEAMLKHFLSMVCDEYSTVFDPTCGSGNVLKVAKQLKADRVLGLELSKDFYEVAVANWEKPDVLASTI
jgi:ParB/RepB/Spo0J family partition protein